MNRIEKLLWKMRCRYYSRKIAIYVVLGDRKKASDTFNKVLDLMEAYKNIYL